MMTATPRPRADIFRLALLILLLGQMSVYYDTAVKTIPHIEFYLLINLGLIVLTLLPWRRMPDLLWVLVWPVGALLHWDWAVRPTNSDVFWATSQAVDFLLHGQNPYTQVYTWVYEHQPGISNYPSYSYFPGGLFAEIPFYLLGNVRYGLALADLGIALLLYLLARPRLGVAPARALAAFWLLFLPGFQVAMLFGALDFLLLFWIALAVWLYSRGWPVASGLATAMAFSTKQYGFLFAIPWGMLLARPLLLAAAARWREGVRGVGTLTGVPRRLWGPPLAAAGLAVLVIVPIALLSPKAFTDATVGHHSSYMPDPMLGTPQWNQSITAQLVGVGWLRLDDAARLAALLFPLLLLGVMVAALLRTRDVAGALGWAALAVGLAFAFNSLQVQFFYWRLALLLGILYFIVAFGADHASRPAPAGPRELGASASGTG